MQMVQDIPWFAWPFNCLYYFVCSTTDHLLIFMVGGVLLSLVSLCRRVSYKFLLKRWVKFSCILLLAGAAMGGCCWDPFVYGRFYVTADYVSDFSPFVPITQGVIDYHFDDYKGHLIGVSILQLQGIWLLCAIGTWASAVGIYFRGRQIRDFVAARRLTVSSKRTWLRFTFRSVPGR